ncbi:MAG TPA: hypothetical protein VM425_15555 [Myxococcota bacterium]|nr:hypothetical protein [Myxococcota bacterium]
MDREREALETYLRIFSPVLLVAALLPFDFLGNDPVWPWMGFLDAGWAGRVAILAPVLCAASFFSLSRLGWHKAATSAAALSLLGLGWLTGLLANLGPHPLRVFGHLTDGLPPLFGRAFWLLLMGISLLAAGVRLGAKGFYAMPGPGQSVGDPWCAARLLTGAGIVLGLLFYLLPYRGDVPLITLIGDIAQFGTRLDDPMVLALAAGHVLSLGPLALALASIPRLWRRAPESGGMLLLLLLAYLPVLSLLVGVRNLVVQAGYTLLHVRAAALILAVQAGAALAVAALVRSVWFEVPWVLGSLTRMDLVLASALARGSLPHDIKRLNVLVRPFAGRRLALWRLAAAEVPGAREADLSRVIRLVEERLRDESEPDEKRPRTDWPWWMRGHRPTVMIACALLALSALSLLAVHRQRVTNVCELRPPDSLLDEIFAEQIPAMIIELSQKHAAPAGLPAYAVLLGGLTGAENACPGIRAAVLELIDLGGRGRLRLHSIWRARDRLNRLLRGRGIPYFVRGRIRAAAARGERDLFYLLDYRITGCRRYREAGGSEVLPVLLLARADRLNIVEQYVGATAEEEVYATILTDRVAELMARRIAPLVERDDALGSAARAGLAAAGTTPEELSAGPQGRLGQLLIEGLTRHELHHRWLGLQPEPPPAIWALMSADSEQAVSGVTSELGAYLGELGYSPAYARLRLALMMANLEEPQGVTGIHGRATLFLLASLFKIDPHLPPRWLAEGVKLAAPMLITMEDEELMHRLNALHRELFGRSIPVFVKMQDPG